MAHVACDSLRLSYMQSLDRHRRETMKHATGAFSYPGKHLVDSRLIARTRLGARLERNGRVAGLFVNLRDRKR
jgi:hypothetical protein